LGVVLVFVFVITTSRDDNSSISTTNSTEEIGSKFEEERTTSDYDLAQEEKEPAFDPNEEYRNNSLETGAKPYASYFGRAQTGQNYIDFKTSGLNDYVVIVKKHSNNKYINHIYIRGGDNARLNIPSGTYDVYFYSGKGWNPNMVIGDFNGGFVNGGTTQKDGPIQLSTETITLDDGRTQTRTAYMEYTLYPVIDGNLVLQSADIYNVLN